jgi:hypothetical protein
MSARDLVTARRVRRRMVRPPAALAGPRLVLPVPGGRKPGSQVVLSPAASTRGVTSRATSK